MRLILWLIKLPIKLFLFMMLFIVFPFELAISLLCIFFGLKLCKIGVKKLTCTGLLLWLLIK